MSVSQLKNIKETLAQVYIKLIQYSKSVTKDMLFYTVCFKTIPLIMLCKY